MKTLSFASPTKQVTQLGKDLIAGGYRVEKRAGYMSAYADDKQVVVAMQHSNRTWIIRGEPEVLNKA